MPVPAKPDASLADELALRELVARYADAVNRRDVEAWTATWSRDGVWHLFGRDVEGRDAVVAMWQGAMGMFDFVLQLIHSGTVDVQGDAATGRWYLSEVAHTTKGERLLTVGVYHDRMTREADGWCFAHRRFDVLYQGPPDLSGTVTPFPALGDA